MGIPLCIIVTWLGGYFFVAGLGLLAAVGYRELAGMIRLAGPPVAVVPGAVAAFLFPAIVYLHGLAGAAAYAAVLLLVFPALAIATIDLSRGPIRGAALTFFGILYVGGLLAFAVPLRAGWILAPPAVGDAAARAHGTFLFFLPVTITWLADTAAFTGGRAFGKRPLAPRISPNKTVAGGVCALLAGTGAAVLYVRLFLPEAWTPGLVPTLAFGLIVSALATVGDLVESALKRECGAKDSSRLLPGHGGLLDRLDSVLWALPAAVLLLALLR